MLFISISEEEKKKTGDLSLTEFTVDFTGIELSGPSVLLTKIPTVAWLGYFPTDLHVA